MGGGEINTSKYHLLLARQVRVLSGIKLFYKSWALACLSAQNPYFIGWQMNEMIFLETLSNCLGNGTSFILINAQILC